MDPLVFIVALAFLIFIHELGHFVAAKRLGMYVEEFAIGFPPRVWGKKIAETLYAINAIPIGGYVKIFGEDEAQLSSKERKDPRAFHNQPSWKRLVVLLAGVVMNFIFGWFVISAVFTQGVAVPTDKVKVVNVAAESPAEEAGIVENDIIVAADGDKIDSSEKLIDVTSEKLEEEVSLTLLRGGKELSVKLVPREDPPAGQGAMGVVVSDFEEKKYSLVEAPWLGLRESVRISKFFYQELFGGVKRLVSGERPEVAVSGPVGIYNAYRERQGFFEKVLLTGLISLNLALLNIIPFPALDGGHLLFVVLEAVTGRRISTRKKQRMTYAGLIILLVLLALVTVKDVLRLF